MLSGGLAFDMEESPPTAESEPTGPSGARIHAAELYCEVCGRETPHRILRLGTSGRSGATGAIRGTARCRECHVTHSFLESPERMASFALIVSDGVRSTRERLALPGATVVTLHERLPDVERPLLVRKIDRADGRSVRTGRARDISTVWTVPDLGAMIPISIVEGRRTRSTRQQFSPELEMEVGDALRVEWETMSISALRARGHTFRKPGERFPASEVSRIYARRTVSPPEGSIPWSRSRFIPRARASSTSRSARSFSSPGDKRKRSSPRD
jgi:uncharacterized Zn finger protein